MHKLGAYKTSILIRKIENNTRVCLNIMHNKKDEKTIYGKYVICMDYFFFFCRLNCY